MLAPWIVGLLLFASVLLVAGWSREALLARDATAEPTSLRDP